MALVNPVNYNRAGRRQLGFRFPVAERDSRVVPGTGAPSLPRYVRRHFVPDLMTAPATRRQRRHRARIQRLMRQFA